MTHDEPPNGIWNEPPERQAEDDELVGKPTEGDQPIDDTSEHQRTLHESTDRLRGWQAPKIDFDVIKMTGISRIFDDATRATRAAGGSLAPFLEAQQDLARKLHVINSDFFKAHAASQVDFARVNALLIANSDFGLSGAAAKIAQQFGEQQAIWLQNLSPKLAHLQESFYPPNLRDIEDLRLEDVEKVVMADGIALYGVPSTSIAAALIRAGSAAERRIILGRQWQTISSDCRAVVTSSKSDSVAPYVPFAIAALNALKDGHTQAAQALVGSLLDSLVNAYFGKARYSLTPNSRTTTAAAYDDFNVREFIAFAPIWQAWQQFRPGVSGQIPRTFSRNATAHTVSGRQFNRRNAVQGLLLASSMIYFLEEQGSRRQAS